MSEGILYLSRSDVERACAELDSVALVAEALALHAQKETVLPDEAYLAWTNQSGEAARSLNMPGALLGTMGAVGTKIINANPANPRHGLARASGLTLLFDPEAARIECIMEGAHISALRTASMSVLSSRLFQAAPIGVVALIGAGELARVHLAVLAAHLRDLAEIRIFDVDPARAADLFERSNGSLASRGIDLRLMTTAAAAIQGADLVLPVTTTTTGYIPLAWLKPGVILVNVSLDDPLPEVVLESEVLVVDDWGLVKADHRRLIGRMYRQGLVTDPEDPNGRRRGSPRRIDAQLGEIVVGSKRGRERAEDRVLVNPFGLSIEDIAVAARAAEVARRLGLGCTLPR